MAMPKIKFMIFNYESSFKCEATNISSALDLYIEKVPKFNSYFSLSEDQWNIIKNIEPDATKVNIINSLIKRDSYKIKEIIYNYSTVDGILVLS